MSRFFKNRKSPFKNLNRQLHLEVLEGRALPSCTSISGFVYYDANNNGLYDKATETPIANSSIELRDSNNVVVGSTTTDANGFYEFTQDRTHPTLDSTLVKTVTFDKTQTNFTLQGMLDQFDPSLGQLESIEIKHDGSITSEISVENFSNQSASDINGTVSGTLTLTGPGSLSNAVTINGQAGSFHASTYDGNTDFGGTSGSSFGEKTANGTNTVTLTGADMDAYKGTGKVTLTENANATSDATGGGNLDVRVRSTGKSTVTVTYHYKAFDCLPSGDYTIIQTQQPAGFTDGKESKDGVVDPNSVGTDFIHVTLPPNADLVNNDFGELKLTQISGHVWYDADNNGVRGPTEALIPGTTITLEGPGGPLTKLTDANGFYAFTDLQPGTYTVKETQPLDYLDGKDNAGTVNGIARGTVVNDPAQDQIQSITLAAGDDSINNDFGEIKPASLAGHVWFDANNDGVRALNELPIPGTTVTLTGFDDKGPVSVPAQLTNSMGEYKFTNLRPGTYALTETQPVGYADGKDAIGTPGGTTGNDVFSDIHLVAGFDGVNNDFGEIKSDNPLPPDPLPKNVNLQGMLPIISKNQLLNDATSDYLEPVIRGQMAFVVGTTVTLTNQQPDLHQTLAGVQQLQNGVSPVAFVNQLYQTDAHRAFQVSNLYNEILNRGPTAAEQSAGIAQLSAGAGKLAVLETIFTSPAYQQLHPTTDSLATALSQDILNTTPGTVGQQSLLQSMANQPLATVVHDLLNSDASLGNQIDDTYRETVRRAATTAEIQTWTTAIKAGTTTLDELAQRLLGSAEFYQLAFNTIH